MQRQRTPGDGATEADDDDLLGEAQHKIFRSCVGRLLYLSQYRLDIQWVLRELCRVLQAPNMLAWRRHNHLTCYLIGARDLCIFFPSEGEMRELCLRGRGLGQRTWAKVSECWLGADCWLHNDELEPNSKCCLAKQRGI